MFYMYIFVVREERLVVAKCVTKSIIIVFFLFVLSFRTDSVDPDQTAPKGTTPFAIPSASFRLITLW